MGCPCLKLLERICFPVDSRFFRITLYIRFILDSQYDILVVYICDMSNNAMDSGVPI